MNMKKVIWYLMIVLVVMLACKSQTIQPETVNFEFIGESTGNASFNVSQLTSDKKTKLIISTDPIKLKITTKEQVYDLKNYTSSTDLKAQILEYQEPLKGILPEIPFPVGYKPIPVIKTWNATEGTIIIQLIEGQPLENRQCTNPYKVTVKLSNVKFNTNDNKESFTLKTQLFKDFRVGWCPE
jgi:U3 small nucleolar ribonucleoprotein component